MRMTEAEKRVIRFLEAHKWGILYAAVTVLSMFSRFGMRYFASGDMADFLRPWADQIRANGGFAALKEQVGNYGILYQTLIALITCLPIPPEYGYKFLSIFFDYALGIVSALIIRDLSGDRLKSFLTYSFLIMLPMVVLNSAAWAQCDSIFTFFCVLCFWLLIRGKYTPAFIAYGAAFAFKLQAVFLLPFLILFYLRERKFSIFNFLMIPAVMMVSGLAGFLAGRSLLAPLQIYFDQAGQYEYISINYPSFWNLLVTDSTETFYHELSPYCIAFALTVLLAELLVAIKGGGKPSKESYLFAAMVMSYTCVLLLPGMHDRYGYVYIIFGLILAVLKPGSLILFSLMVMMDMQSYGFFLFGTLHVPSNVLGLMNTGCLISYMLLWGREELYSGRDKDGRPLIRQTKYDTTEEEDERKRIGSTVEP